MGVITLMIGAFVVKRYLTKKEERRLDEYEGHNGEAQGTSDIDQRIMIADCIEDVYRRAKDKGEGNTFGQRWREHHFEFVSLQDLLKEDLQRCNDRELKRLRKRLAKEERKKYIAVLRKKAPAGANPAGLDWMVAIRGTESVHDLRNNLKTSLELLHTSSTVKLLKIVILRLVKIMRVEGSDPSKLAVAGHSLGAAKAMLVTRMLALGPDRLFLNCHFFNPPYAAFVSMVIEGVRKLSSPFLDFARLNAEGIWDKFTTVEALVSYVFNTVVDGGKMLDKLNEEFIALSDWSPPPRFYLNEYDIFSGPFVRHFRRPKGGIFRFYPHAGLARAVLDTDHLKTKTFHLFPRGSICTAYTALTLKGPVEAHSLDTWTRRDLRVIVEDVNLVDEDEKRMFERTGAEKDAKRTYERAGAEEDSEDDDGDSENNEDD